MMPDAMLNAVGAADVLFIEDLARVLRTSRSTIEQQQQGCRHLPDPGAACH